MYDEIFDALGIDNKNIQDYTLPQYIRVNTLKISEEKLIKRLENKKITLQKVPYLKYCYEIMESEFALSSTEEYLMGYFYIQDAASQFPVELLDPKPNETILDMCAAPGSKTTYCAQLMKNKGHLVALDIQQNRLTALKNNIERLGITNTTIFNKDGMFVSDLNMTFDRILLDAPCSGNYTMCDYVPRTPEDLSKKSANQKRLIRAASAVLNKGGILVYSTCSLEQKEDEEVVSWALENLDLELIEITNQLHPGLIKGTARFFPHLDKTQGFFVSLFKKI
ncbi:RsmB/NOP family class I SAM-dependent RNA methyltransferase [Candidatus Woesearchaeota archaeon]|nr:RsmB/NOP family class I SAM-dependent RNA methyltransferase [Candidatus Woesearchaeota archaeon]